MLNYVYWAKQLPCDGNFPLTALLLQNPPADTEAWAPANEVNDSEGNTQDNSSEVLYIHNSDHWGNNTKNPQTGNKGALTKD